MKRYFFGFVILSASLMICSGEAAGMPDEKTTVVSAPQYDGGDLVPAQPVHVFADCVADPFVIRFPKGVRLRLTPETAEGYKSSTARRCRSPGSL
jgi:hypothetical protein